MRLLLLAVLLAGCSTQSQPLPPLDQNIQTLLSNLKAVSVADLQNAEAIAVANNDVLMQPCYPALIQFVQSFAGPTGTVSGAFSAFETARVTRMGMMGGLPAYLKLGCAAGVMDEGLFVARLAAMLGAATVLGPIAPVIVPAADEPPVPSPTPPRPVSVIRHRLKRVLSQDPATIALSEMALADRALAMARSQ